MDNEEIIKMLNADITGEIEAILTYLRHNLSVVFVILAELWRKLHEMKCVTWNGFLNP